MSILTRIYALSGRTTYRILRPLLKLYLSKVGPRSYVILSCGGEILVIKSWLGSQRWHLPGGGIKEGEDPAEAVTRETKEEVGVYLQPKELHLVAEGLWSSGGHNHLYHIFGVEVATKPKITLRRREILEAQWLWPAELTEANMPAEMRRAISDWAKANGGAGLLQ